MMNKQLRVNERKVRIAMASAGIRTIEELARRSSLGTATLTNILRGEGFRSSTVDALARALGGSPIDYLEVVDQE